MDKTYSALDIARYVINYCNQNGWEISNLKLQKLLYYIQAYFLNSRGSICFIDSINCERSGPYVPYVKDLFYGYSIHHIEKQDIVRKIHFDDVSFSFVLKEEKFTDDFLENKDKERINDVLKSLAFRDQWFLVDRTNEEDPILNAKIFKRSVSIEDMKSFFKRHPERIFGVYTKKIRG